jgi:hypothetical protein
LQSDLNLVVDKLRRALEHLPPLRAGGEGGVDGGVASGGRGVDVGDEPQQRQSRKRSGLENRLGGKVPQQEVAASPWNGSFTSNTSHASAASGPAVERQPRRLQPPPPVDGAGAGCRSSSANGEAVTDLSQGSESEEGPAWPGVEPRSPRAMSELVAGSRNKPTLTKDPSGAEEPTSEEEIPLERAGSHEHHNTHPKRLQRKMTLFYSGAGAGHLKGEHVNSGSEPDEESSEERPSRDSSRRASVGKFWQKKSAHKLSWMDRYPGYSTASFLSCGNLFFSLFFPPRVVDRLTIVPTFLSCGGCFLFSLNSRIPAPAPFRGSAIFFFSSVRFFPYSFDLALLDQTDPPLSPCRFNTKSKHQTAYEFQFKMGY